MADISIQKIEEKLNELFPDYGQRKIVFWFDPLQEFLEDIASISIQNAKIYHLEKTAQFQAKRQLEYIDPTSNYLVYAPFPRWNDKDEDNHMLSILQYAEEFSADKTTILMNDLKIPLRFQQTIETYSSFFNSKERINRFMEFNTTLNSKEAIELTLLASLVRAKRSRMNEILLEVLQQFTSGEENPLAEIEKFGLLEKFWEFVKIKFGYQNENPSLEKLSIALFLNYFYYQIDQELPNKFKEFDAIHLRNNIIAFIDQYMNDTRYLASFDRLSTEVFKAINGEELLNEIKIDELLEADVFKEIHERILTFYIERLISKDTTTKIAGKTIFEGLKQRERLRFSQDYFYDYQLLKHASYLVNEENLKIPFKSNELLLQYEKELYWIDTHYRKFIWNSDQILDIDHYTQLLRLVEANYLRFLDQSCQLWNENFDFSERPSIRQFFNKAVRNKMVKTVVIISDAFRYELAQNLQRQFAKEKKYSANLDSYFSVLPSVTEFGKAALLPHNQLEYLDGTEVLVDGLKTNGLVNRNTILQKKIPTSVALNYDDVIAMTKTALRENLNGRDVIYIYHDQVDKTGDHGNEKQVFDASKKAIDEIFRLVKRLQNDAQVYRFIVTADHGFIYHRGKVTEADKIDNPSQNKADRVERRFILTTENYNEVGTKNYSLGASLGNEDPRNICVPITSSIFKKAGGGQNYVHGGSSIQEMLVPVLEITAARGSNSKEPVEVELMTRIRKITGLAITLEFYQKQPISELFDPSEFSIYFEDAQGLKITKEVNYLANSKSEDSNQRFQRFTFDFINQSYSVNDDYFLVVKNLRTDISEKTKFVIDNPFAKAFDFDI